MANDSLPELECDVVMKGGITSGVVYPEALLRLKDHYRFRNVGGASAGAIAAGVAAAAEFARANGATGPDMGFNRVAKLPSEMAKHLSELFQPDPSLASLHGVFVAATTKNLGAILWAVLRGYWKWLIGALAIGLISGWLACYFGQAGPGLTLTLGSIAFVLSGVLLLVLALLLEIFVALPANDFGLCPGPTQGSPKFPGLSDWIAAVIEEAAGNPFPKDAAGYPNPKDPSLENRRPVMFGDLAAKHITLKMMTTNLSLGLGHVLPLLDDKNYFWDETEMRKVLPRWVVDYMAKVPPDPRSGLRPFPAADELPIAVGIRMSLSFPGLISAVRLHRINFAADLIDDAEPEPQLMLFSDGGISSNFPVQFFDSLFPGRPTFGISLDEVDPTRKPRQVYLPMSARRGRWFPLANQIKSLASFGMAIVNTAKDWQDRRLGVLSGYRERIAHIFLTSSQGGLNLTMEPTLITELGNYGDRAAALMLRTPVSPDEEAFDFADHQWRRFLVTYYQIEQLLEEMHGKWGSGTTPGSFAALMQATLANPPSYKDSTPQWRSDVWDRMDKLMAFAGQTFQPALRNSPDAIPKHKARLQIVPEA